jgi:hypothetical protein
MIRSLTVALVKSTNSDKVQSLVKRFRDGLVELDLNKTIVIHFVPDHEVLTRVIIVASR